MMIITKQISSSRWMALDILCVWITARTQFTDSIQCMEELSGRKSRELLNLLAKTPNAYCIWVGNEISLHSQAGLERWPDWKPGHLTSPAKGDYANLFRFHGYSYNNLVWERWLGPNHNPTYRRCETEFDRAAEQVSGAAFCFWFVCASKSIMKFKAKSTMKLNEPTHANSY